MSASDPSDRSADMSAVDGLNIGISAANKSCTSTTPVLCAVGSTNLTPRKYLWITPVDGNIYIGPAGVTTANGTPVFKNSTWPVECTENVSWYMVSSSGTVNVRIIEGL